jgi:hypothetical protein
MTAKRSKTDAAYVAELCLYGTTDARIGAGYLGVVSPHGQTFGTGEPKPGRTFTECIFMAAGELAARGITSGVLRVYDAGGARMADLDLGAALPIYGSIGTAPGWKPAPVYTISVPALEAVRS